MNDATLTPRDIAGDAGLSPQSSNGQAASAKAGDRGADRAPNAVRFPPIGWRRPSRSWLPGLWEDPF
jgi:hypothetical protein